MTDAGCSVCGRLFERHPVVVEGERGAVRSQIEGIGLLSCPEGHERRPAEPERVAVVIEDLRGGLLVSARSKLPWRAERCGACREPLTMPGRRTTRSVTVTSTEDDAFTVTLDVPMLRCTECAGDNLPRGAWPDVEAATRSAIGSA